jgi:hypothetical protein
MEILCMLGPPGRDRLVGWRVDRSKLPVRPRWAGAIGKAMLYASFPVKLARGTAVAG